MYVIGTAGHVDHGKSTLVQALSGINPDRLAEEQRREMTIDLGFAWLTLPSGRDISIVDVPGHEDFIKNMLAGVGGIDVALLVVAADEGVMPQTREHLAILDLLQVTRGVVALTKADLVEDDEWLELVEDDLRVELATTSLAQAQIVPVSAKTGRGLSELMAVLDALLDDTPEPADLGRPRLPIDRVFTISGFGTVVTGTLMDGCLRLGDEMEIMPGGLGARIRGLQSHKTKVEEAVPGSRVAVNLTGVDNDDLRRGQVLTLPGALTETRLVDASLRMLADAPLALKHNAQVYLHIGSDSVLARCRLLDCEIVEPGQTGWVQFRLEHPIACTRHDRYVIRLVSPSYTLGGGQVVEPSPVRRHRRMRANVIERLRVLAQGSPQDVMRLALRGRGALPVERAVRESRLGVDEAADALEALRAEDALIVFGEPDFVVRQGTKTKTSVILADDWAQLVQAMRQQLAAYYQAHRLSLGMPREDLRSRVFGEGSEGVDLLAMAAAAGHIRLLGTTVALPDHQVVLTDEQQRLVAAAYEGYRGSRTPPSSSQLEQDVGAELAQLMLDRGQLVRLSEDVLFDAQEFETIKQEIVTFLGEHQTVTVAQARDLLAISRRLALALLEHLDQERITKRVRDLRVLR